MIEAPLIVYPVEPPTSSARTAGRIVSGVFLILLMIAGLFAYFIITGDGAPPYPKPVPITCTEHETYPPPAGCTYRPPHYETNK